MRALLYSPRRHGPAVLALLVVLGGCGGDKSAPAPLPTPSASSAPVNVEAVFADLRAAAATVPTTAGALSGALATAGALEGGAGSAAAELRAGLAAGLVEHVHLTVLAVSSAYRFQGGSPAATAAAGAVQANATALADLVAKAASGERDRFLAAWSRRIAAEISYATAADDGPEGQVARRAASAQLLTNAKELAAIFADASDGALSISAVQREFVAASTRITAVLDALGVGSTDLPKRLRAADDQARALAATLAGGLDRAGDLPGDPSQAAPTLRADLAGALTEGLYLTGLSAFSAATSPEGAAAPVAVAARDAAAAVAQSLATVVGGPLGRERQGEFLSMWRQYVEDLHAYASADENSRTNVGARLAGFPGNLAAFLVGAGSDAFTAAEVTGTLTPAVAATVKALDSLRTLQGVPVVVQAPPPPAAPATPTAAPTPTESATPAPTLAETAAPAPTP